MTDPGLTPQARAVLEREARELVDQAPGTPPEALGKPIDRMSDQLLEKFVAAMRERLEGSAA